MKNISFRTDVLPLKNELFRLALRITLNREEAEDVVQETMMKVWNRREDWEKIESIEAFCLTVCRNLAVDKTRRRVRDEGLRNAEYGTRNTDYDPPDTSYASNPEEQAEQRDRIQLVRTLINALPEKQRSVMQLRDIEGKSYKEIAAILDISEEQVKINIFRARQTIKQRYLEIQEYGL